MDASASIRSSNHANSAASAHGAASRRRLARRRVLLHATLIFFCALIVLPLLWVLMLSIKSLPDSYTGTLWPKQFDFTSYPYVFEKMPFVLGNLSNSIIVALTTVTLTSLCAVLAGYAIVHLRMPGKIIVVALLVGTLYFPTRIVSLIGIYRMQADLGLINTLPGLILPYVTLNLALSILVMKGIFEQISPELLEAAKIDGASSWRILWSIMVPLIANGLVVLLIINFVTAWGEYLLAYTLTNDQAVRTLPVVLAGVAGGFGQWAWPRLAAIYVLAITPGIITFAIAQRWYMKGLQEGALKF
jgi:ABC-type glycerol-3-phosphate transport system permease component